MNILKAILWYELSYFSAPIKVTSKQCDCIILSKSSSCSEQPYVRTQLAIATARKNRNDPAQKWCCNETHKETRLKNHAARRTNKKKLHSQLAIASFKSVSGGRAC